VQRSQSTALSATSLGTPDIGTRAILALRLRAEPSGQSCQLRFSPLNCQRILIAMIFCNTPFRLTDDRRP
jgi:hypothetical protein